jgi:hypothetical protein
VVFWFFAFKEGFVRHDPQHDVFFFGAVLGGFLAFRWRGADRALALLGLAVLVAFFLQAATTSITSFANPITNVRTAFDQTRDVANPARRAAAIRVGRAEIESADPLDQRTLSLLHGHTVAIWPSEIAVAWAYRLDWDPLPVLQSYNAYTSALDNLDAAFLASSRAPQRLLVLATPDPDGRIVAFDEATTSRAILCRYRLLYATATAAVLAHESARCGQEKLIARVHLGWGETVAVPAAPGRSLVSMRIAGVGVGGLERIISLFYKPAERFVRINDGQPRRLVTGTAADGLPLLAASGVDFPQPFNIAANAKRIAIMKDGSTADHNRSLTLSFYAQTVAKGTPWASCQKGVHLGLTRER